MSSKLKPCPSCGKEVSKSAKVCPHCGKKLKMGLFPKILIGFGILIVLFIFGSPSEEQRATRIAQALEEVSQTNPANIQPTGELAEMFNPLSDHTNIQRENKIAEITGQVVQWTLPVYEVRKMDNYYRVQTIARTGGFNHEAIVGAFINLYPRSDQDAAFIEGLKTEDTVTIKGRIKGSRLRHIEIDDAYVIR